MNNEFNAKVLELMPENLRSPDNQALSAAICMGMQRLLLYSSRMPLLADIEHVPEKILDLLALELRTQYYDTSMPVETKRKLVMQTIPWYWHSGTPSVLEEYLGTIYNGGEVQEWFDYGGEPFFFQVKVFIDEAEEFSMAANTEVKKRVLTYKNVRSWLEKMIYAMKTMYFISIRYESALTFLSEFYPRGNKPYLFLDGKWNLDGTYYLNGWQDAEDDYYRSRLRLQSDNRVDVQMENTLTIEKDLWLLDGTYFLDGEKLLDAEVIEYAL